MTLDDLRRVAEFIRSPALVVSLDGTIMVANAPAVELGAGLVAGRNLREVVADGEDPRPQLRTCARQTGMVPFRLRLATSAPETTSGVAWAMRVEVAGKPMVALQAACPDETPFAQLNDRLDRLQREVRYRRTAEEQRDVALQTERAARQRLARLQCLTGALSRAADLGAVTDVVLSTGVDELEAAEAWLCLLDERQTTFEVVGHVGALEHTVDRWRRFPREKDLPVSDALDRDEPVVWESLAERDRQYPMLRDDPMAHGAYIIAPMIAESVHVGALVVGFAGPRRIDETDRAFVRAAADQTAQAVLRARAHETEAIAHRRQRFLAEASLLLSKSLEYEDVLREVAELAVPTLADGCVVHLADDSGLRPVAVAHADPQRRKRLDQLVGRERRVRNRYILQVARTGEPLLLSTMPEEIVQRSAEDAEHRRMIDDLGLSSVLVVALAARGRTLGTLTLVSTDPTRLLGERELAVAEDLAARAALAVDNARLYAERSEAARVLQQALLPPRLPSIPGVELAARHRPATEMLVGGDFYDVFENSDGSWTVLIGDVCGKDTAAATLTGLARHTARAITARDATPREVLEVMNDAFLQYESSEQFCTAVCARLHHVDGGIELELAVAGHPPPIVLRGGGGAEALEPGGQPVGLFHESDLRTDRVVLASGDALVLYTDGVTEARQGDAMFGDDRLLATLRRHSAYTADELADRLVEAVVSYQGETRTDDTAVVVLRAR